MSSLSGFAGRFELAHTSLRLFWAIAALLAVLTLGFELEMAAHLGGDRLTTAVDDVGQSLAALLAALACGAAAARTAGRMRTGWALIALSALTWTAGEAVWTYREVGLGLPVPTPSLPDLGFLLAIPPAIAGLLLLTAASGARRERLRSLVDGFLVASSLLLVSWELVLRTTFEDSRLPALAKIVSLTYPVADVVMLTVVVVALTHIPRARLAPMVLLGAGIAGLAVSDTAFTYLTAAGTYGSTPLDAGWFAGFLLVALASLRADSAAGAGLAIRVPGVGRAAAPYFAIALAILAATAVVLTQGQLDRIGVRIGAVIAGLSFLSQLLMTREKRVLLGISLANQEALRESRASLTEVIANAPVALFSIDAGGILTLATGRALGRFGEAAEHLAGRRVDEILAEFPEFLGAIRSALQGNPGQLRVRFPHGDLEVRLLPVLEEGRVVLVNGVAVDISEQRVADEARRENDAKSRFLATMSHELRTPLNSVIGFAELLAGERPGTLNGDQMRYVRNIETSGNHLLRLINEVLDLSRIASGEVQVQAEPLDLGEVVLDTVAQLRPIADRKGIALHALCPSGITVLADPIRTRQVLLNLLSNAIKFTPAGGRVELEAAELGGRAEIRVRDTGIGIAPEHLERIFEEYAQVPGAGEGAEGTGLGLAVSRRLAVLMKGTVTVESELGKGSTFTATLPTRPAKKPVRAAVASRRKQDAIRAPAQLAEESGPA